MTRSTIAWIAGAALLIAAVVAILCWPAASPGTVPPVPVVADRVDDGRDDGPPLVVEAPGEAPEGMSWVPGGWFEMGAVDGNPDERPRHLVELDGFWIDQSEVTNAQFAAFVEETGFVTAAEKKPTFDSVRPGSPLTADKIKPEMNVPGSICRNRAVVKGQLDPVKGAYNWWRFVPGADWRHPEGPDSSIDDRMGHPVVHVSWRGAMAYCRWAGKQLPTEAQWEFAARGGRARQVYPWGNDRNPDDRWLNNIWQGDFPFANTVADGFETTAPVKSFPPNDYGLYDMSGNVWEWCADNYRADYYDDSPRRNPRGPRISLDPDEPYILKRVQRGGSFMCSDSYCIGYRVAARMKGEEDSGMFHTGFRCVVGVEELDRVRAAR